MQISIICQSPTCEKQGEAINAISGLSLEQMKIIIEAWRGKDRADTCASCGNLGVQDDAPLVAEQSGEDAAYLATLHGGRGYLPLRIPFGVPEERIIVAHDVKTLKGTDLS